MTISVIVPTLNEEDAIERTLAAVQQVEGIHEIIVADGGSRDRTLDRARPMASKAIVALRGRGTQMREGALAASGDVLWFLHADTIPPPGAAGAIRQALADPGVAAGNFRLLFEGPSRSARQLTAIYPWLRLLGLSFGDSGIFVRRSVYQAAGGFRPYPLFEDLDLVRRVRARGRFVHLDCTLTTSSRRFENRNFGRVWANWIVLQVLYWAGLPPHLLARWYRQVR